VVEVNVGVEWEFIAQYCKEEVMLLFDGREMWKYTYKYCWLCAVQPFGTSKVAGFIIAITAYVRMHSRNK
jgi:hypothetical protein